MRASFFLSKILSYYNPVIHNPMVILIIDQVEIN